MGETGYRTDIFLLDGIAGSQRGYLHWSLDTRMEGRVRAEEIVTEEALDLLVSRLRMPPIDPAISRVGSGSRPLNRRKAYFDGARPARTVPATG